MKNRSEMKEVFTVTERQNAKAIWTRVGVGFVNRDNSINVLLDSIPINGKLHIRDMRQPSNGEESNRKGTN